MDNSCRKARDAVVGTTIFHGASFGALKWEAESRHEFSSAGSNDKQEEGKPEENEKEMSREKRLEMKAKDMMGDFLPKHIETVLGGGTHDTNITVQDGRFALWKYLEDYLIGLWEKVIISFIETRIETSFNISEFKEGAKDAMWALYTFGNTRDYPLLKPMVSDVMFYASKAIFEEYKSKGLDYKPHFTGDRMDARIIGLQFMNKRMTADHTSEAEGSAEADASAEEIGGKWLVVSVEFKSSCAIDITKGEEVVSKVVDSSPKIVKFASGPLPSILPVGTLDTSWWVLSYS